jgi:hypothetical protein
MPTAAVQAEAPPTAAADRVRAREAAVLVGTETPPVVTAAAAGLLVSVVSVCSLALASAQRPLRPQQEA